MYMKKKCFIIAISLIAVIVIGIIFFLVLRELKWKHEHSMIESKVNNSFEEMIVFC